MIGHEVPRPGSVEAGSKQPLYLSPIEIWRWLAVASIVAANLLVASLRTADPCADVVSLGLFVGWIAAPAVAIASLVVVSRVGEHLYERLFTAALGITLTVGWAYVLVWSSVGLAIDGAGC